MENNPVFLVFALNQLLGLASRVGPLAKFLVCTSNKQVFLQSQGFGRHDAPGLFFVALTFRVRVDFDIFAEVGRIWGVGGSFFAGGSES